MTAPTQHLVDEHRRIDAALAALPGDDHDPAALRTALALLREHIHAEETVLFAPLQQAGLAMPVFVMKREHGLMWPLMIRIDDACGAGASVDALREPCRQLFQLLQIHNHKEEQILYAAADRLAGAAAGEQLRQALRAARMPAGWACELAPH
ncbi:MAG: hemerythrin domain-containing protein [Rhodanobacteraceae bacterium]|nr:hemerythrin domain-containing protein [Rhodanobacteraceae bacterium]